MTHTPGPWKYLPDERMVESALPGWKGEFEHICDLRSPVSEANAALIAAAPMLLEACEMAKEYIGVFPSDSPRAKTVETYENLKAAIAKAKGQNQ